jgi:hypothetical protein
VGPSRIGETAFVPEGRNDRSLVWQPPDQECSQEQSRLHRGGYDRFAIDIRVIMRGDRSRNRKSQRTLWDGPTIGQVPGPATAGLGYGRPYGTKCILPFAMHHHVLY